MAESTPRRTPGTIGLLGYRIRYADLLTLCPQWHDLFVRETYKFRADGDALRIVDGGANVGLASLYFKRLYPKARVTAYEADPALAALLRENLSANGAADVEVVAAALWTKSGAVPFQCEGADSGAVNGVSAGLAGEVRPVPALRLRDLLEIERVDLLKLDVEGAEAALLEDCRDRLDNVSALLMELHEFDPAVRRTPDVLRLLSDAGFVYALEELVSLPERDSGGKERSPFPGASRTWAVLVKAWRP